MDLGQLKPHERATLDIGLYTVIAASGFGVAAGRWPFWTVVVALAAYFVWVVAYAEATVRVTLRSRASTTAAAD